MFSAEIVNGKLYGRGSADMKSSLAVMVMLHLGSRMQHQLFDKTPFLDIIPNL